jgi:hypothetical protein
MKVKMFTDEKMVSLRGDNNYRKSKSIFNWNNFRLSFSAIRSGAGVIPTSISSVRSVLIFLYSFLFRRYYITREITDCRSNIIENLLNDESPIKPEFLIKHFIEGNNVWLEYKEAKVKVLRDACLSYIDTPEYRNILFEYSNISDRESFGIALNNARSEIERLFRHAIIELSEEALKLAKEAFKLAGERREEAKQDIYRDYSTLDDKSREAYKNSLTGNLTGDLTPDIGKNKAEEGVRDDS